MKHSLFTKSNLLCLILLISSSFAYAAEVDGITYVHSEVPLKTGRFINAEINDTLEYDLIGRTV